MATPNENFATLEAYFQWRSSFGAQSAQKQGEDTVYLGHTLWNTVENAATAMDELVRVAANNDHVRQAFAAKAIFNTCLIVEKSGPILDLFTYYNRRARMPRLLMLDGIKRSSVGGFFTARDPSGITSWIYSELVASTTIGMTLATEGIVEVLLATLAILKNAGVPLVWAQSMANPGGALDQLEARISGSQWSSNAAQLVAYQRELAKGVADVKGRYLDAVAREAARQLALAQVKTGDGSMVPTLPPVAKPLYARGEVLVPAIGGLAFGGWLQTRQTR